MSDMKCPNIKIYKCSDGFVTDNAQVAKSHEANIKSDKLLCPFCQQPIVCMDAQDADEYSTWYCPRCIAEKARYAFGNDKLWQELINERQHAIDCQDLFIAAMAQKIDIETKLETTRKALDVAVDALKEIKDGKIPVSLGIYMDINDALEKITALEQKDTK